MKIKLFITLYLCSFLPLSAFTPAPICLKEAVSLQRLFQEGEKYDGQKVTIRGEVIGDIMREGEELWVNVKDGDFFIGALINPAQRDKIEHLGRYRIKGDTVKIFGTYNLHCAKHGGIQDIHVYLMEIIEQGYIKEERVEVYKLAMSFLLGFVTLFYIYYSFRKNARKDNDGQNR